MKKINEGFFVNKFLNLEHKSESEIYKNVNVC